MSNAVVTARDIAKMIDHSLLKPELTMEQIAEGCRLARQYGCASVCVRPGDVELAKGILEGSDVLLTTVIGFPHGSNLTQVKVLEAKIACEQGCREIDMVLNIGRLKSHDYDYVQNDIKAVCDEAHAYGVIVKVILENAYLTDEEKIMACRLCAQAGADFVKTSTGCAPGGATVHDLTLMRQNTPDTMRIKAAGGVRTLDAALMVRKAGGSRFGATATKAICDEAAKREREGTLELPAELAEFSHLSK